MYTNYATKELFLKVAYLGSTAPFFALYEQTSGARTKALARDPIQGGTAYCTFTLALGDIRGYGTRFQLNTIDAKAQSEAHDRLLLRGADVVVAVDIEPRRLAAIRGLVGQTPILTQSAEEDSVGVFKEAARHALTSARDGVERPAAPLEPGERYVEVGKYQLLLPHFWEEFGVEAEPPNFLFHGSVPGIHLEVTCRQDSAEDPAMVVARLAAQFKAQKAEAHPIEVAGLPFVGTRLTQLESETLRHFTVEVFAGRVGPDLIGFFVSRDERGGDALRDLCITMVAAAIIRRMNVDPSPWTQGAREGEHE
jgi:hypothetical protein